MRLVSALVPSGVAALREAGHEVLVETQAGEGSSITDREYMQAGAAHLAKRGRYLAPRRSVVKVKEPQSSEYQYFRPGLIAVHLSAPGAATGADRSACSKRR